MFSNDENCDIIPTLHNNIEFLLISFYKTLFVLQHVFFVVLFFGLTK